MPGTVLVSEGEAETMIDCFHGSYSPVEGHVVINHTIILHTPCAGEAYSDTRASNRTLGLGRAGREGCPEKRHLSGMGMQRNE